MSTTLDLQQENESLRKQIGELQQQLKAQLDALVDAPPSFVNAQPSSPGTTQIQLAHQADLFHLLVNTTNDGFWVINLSGKILQVNERYCEMTGWSREDILQKTFIEIDTNEDLLVMQLQLELILSKGVGRFETQHRCKDGSTLIVEMSMTADTVTGQIIAFIRDISAQEQAESFLRSSENSLKQAQRIAKIGSWSLDLRENKLTWSDEIYRIFEIDPARFEATYEKFLNAIHPDDREMVDYSYNDSLMNQSPYEIEYRLLLPDGRVKYVQDICETSYDEAGKPIQSIGTIHDVTDRKRIEQDYVDSEANYRTLIESSDSLIIKLDRNGLILFANKIAATLFQTSSFTLIGKHLSELFDRDTAQLLRSILEDVFSSGEGAVDDYYIPLGGEWRWYHASLQPVRTANNQPNMAILNAIDITSFKQTQAKLKEAEGKYLRIIDQSPIVVYEDVIGDRFQFISPQIENILGYTPEEWISTPALMQSLIHPDDIGRVMDEIDKVAAGKPNLALEYRILRRDGQMVWVHDEAVAVYNTLSQRTFLRGILYDISEQKRAEAALRQNEETQRILLNAIPESVMLLWPDCRGVAANSATLERLKITSEQFMEGKLFLNLPAEVAEKRHRFVDQVVQSGQAVTFEDSRFGRIMYNSISPVRNENGDVFQVAIFSYDITESRQAAEKVRQAHDELDRLFKMLPVPLSISSTEGAFKKVNPAWSNILGYAENDLLATPIYDLIHPEDSIRFFEDLSTQIWGETSSHYETRFRAKDGSYRWFDWTASTASKDGFFYASAMDVTENRMAEQALRESENRFRTLVEAAPMPISFTRNDQITYINPAYLSMFGYHSAAELLGQPFTNQFAPEVQDPNQEGAHLKSELAFTSGQSEHIGIRKDGSLFNFQINSNQVELSDGPATISFYHDITARKNAEAELQSYQEHLEELIFDRTEQLSVSEERYRALFNAGSDAIYVAELDPVDHTSRIVEVNDIACQRIGISRDDFIDQSFEIIPATRRSRGLADLRSQVLAEGMVVWEEVQPITGGKEITVEINSHFFELQGKQLVINIARDITERKLIEAEIQKAKEAAEAANRAKSIFLANMSHEIRTPMNAILGFAQLILNDTSLTSKHRKYLETINRSGEYLLTLINEILEMSKIEAGHITLNPTAFNLKVLIHDIESMFHLRIESKNLSFVTEQAPDLPDFIVADENKLKEILINLLGNAVKFTQQGGITVRWWAEKPPHLLSDSRQVQIHAEVEDSGIGISEDEIPRLFKTFEQTRSGAKVIGGTGLGLAISQSYAQLMGGQIIVTSQPNRGSIFHMEIKVEVSEAVQTAADLPHRVVIGLKPGVPQFRLLIVDDHEENRNLLTEILERIGLLTRTAANGAEAIDVFLEWNPDMVLMDLRMPIMNGYEATRRIKSMPQGANTPVIALTASILGTEVQQRADTGLDGYVRKPFKDFELFHAIEKKLGDIFLYQQETWPEVHNLRPVNLRLSAEALEILPPDLIEQMLAATVNAHFDALLDLINQVEPYSTVVANGLRKLANDYQYDALMNLFAKE